MYVIPKLPLSAGINKYTAHMYKKRYHRPYNTGIPNTQTRQRTQNTAAYFLKKIHKNPIAVRPIVSSCGGPTEKISEFIGFHLQPHVPKIKYHIKDGGDPIRLLEKTTIPSDSLLATIDIKALYLNIPHAEGIKALIDKLYYKNPTSDEVNIPPNTMTDVLNIVLTQNYFQFADKMYHQAQGTAMGTQMVPAYANFFMSELEEAILDNSPTDPILWKRYIDDILCIWPGAQERIQKIHRFTKQIPPIYQIYIRSSPTEKQFLDITIFKGDRYRSSNKLDVKPCFKKRNKFQAALTKTSTH